MPVDKLLACLADQRGYCAVEYAGLIGIVGLSTVLAVGALAQHVIELLDLAPLGATSEF